MQWGPSWIALPTPLLQVDEVGNGVLDLAVLSALPLDVTAFLILFCRIGAVLMLLPVFSETAIPPQVRLLIGLGATLAFYGMLHQHIQPVLKAGASLPILVTSEMLVGIAMGAIVKILYTAASIAGGIISQQIGLSSALIMDPSIGGQSSVFSRFVTLAATIICLNLGVHHLWIGSIFQSYAIFAVGGFPDAGAFADLAVRVTGQTMSLGVSLAAPLILYGMLFNVGLGLAARVAPSIQVFFITQPLNLLLGFSILAITIGTILTTFADAMGMFMRNGWSF